MGFTKEIEKGEAMYYIDKQELLQQFEEGLGQLDMEVLSKPAPVKDETGREIYLSQTYQALRFENKDEMAKQLVNAVENAIIECEPMEVD